MKYLLFFLCFLFSEQISVNNECKSDFKSINVRDFSLFCTVHQIQKTLPFKLKEINKGLTKYTSYSFTEIIKIQGSNVKVIYYLDFFNDRLNGFHFDIFSDKFFFYKIVNTLKANKNKLVLGESKMKLSYSYSNKECYQFLYLIFRNDKLCTSGGIEAIN